MLIIVEQLNRAYVYITLINLLRIRTYMSYHLVVSHMYAHSKITCCYCSWQNVELMWY